MSIYSVCVCFVCVLFTVSSHANYVSHPMAERFRSDMAAEGFSEKDVNAILAKANRQEAILTAIARPAEKAKPWYDYRAIFLDDKRIAGGVTFWHHNAESLAKASRQFGVPEEIIVAIIGVETRYGKVAGSYYVIDALTTLGFDYPPRSDFFYKELMHFLVLTRQQGVDPLALKGSYAGAMGYGQFMPSSYQHYAIDFDGDKKVDIWNNTTDAIGSVANYFYAHGWKAGGPVIAQAKVVDAERLKHASLDMFNVLVKPTANQKVITKLGLSLRNDSGLDASMLMQPYRLAASEQRNDYWLGFENFYVITRYNHSHMYALAVYQLSQEIKLARERQIAAGS